MPIIEWNETFRMGVEPFDVHHQHLFSLINKTYDMFIQHEPKQHLEPVLDELIDYATYHFTAEEFWMKESAYPKLAEHAVEHDRFSKQVVEFQAGYARGDTALTLEVLQFLHGWLTDHILKIDSEYACFIGSKGAGVTLDMK